MLNKNELIKQIYLSDEYERLFWVLYENSEGITAKELIDKCGFTKRVYTRLKKFEDKGIAREISSKREPYKYNLTDAYRSKRINHLLLFDKIQNNELSILYGDAGNFSVWGLFMRRFFNNHTIYGLPRTTDLTDYEQKILLGLLHQIDSAFEGLKKLKLAHELRKKVDNEKWLSRYSFPFGVVSEKLLLQSLIFWFSQALYQILEQDSDKSKSYKFLYDLKEKVCELAKKHKLGLSSYPYPEKSFVYKTPFFFTLLFASDPEFALKFAENPNDFYDPFIDEFTLIKKKDWFYNGKNVTSLEAIEDEQRTEAHERLFKGTNSDYDSKIALSESESGKSPLIYLYEKEIGRKFYSSELDIDESIALFSTTSIIESTEYKRNIDLKLDYFFKDMFFGSEENYKQLKDDFIKVINMTELVILGSQHKDRISLDKFKRHDKIKEFFTDEEIEFMISVMKEGRKSWINRHECEKFIWYKLYDKGGSWYDNFFYDWAGEMIERLDKGENYKELLGEYDKRLPLKGKGGAFENYVNARRYFEKTKTIEDKKQKKNQRNIITQFR